VKPNLLILVNILGLADSYQEIYCDSTRITNTVGARKYGRDPAMGGRKVKGSSLRDHITCDMANVPSSSSGRPQAFTTSSDLVDEGLRDTLLLAAAATGQTVNPNSYAVPTEFANSITLCKSYTKDVSQDNWPTVDDARIQAVVANSKDIFARKSTPVDALTTLGTTILHEVNFDDI